MVRLTLLAAVLAVAVPGGGYDFPAKNWPNMTARLHVQVADEPDAAGFARVRLTVDVEGPPTLELEPPLLGDATDAWKTQRASAWHVVDGRTHWEETFDLRQVKSGLVPIPSVKVRCRENPTAPWQDAEWTDILTDIRPLSPPPLPRAAPSSSLWWVCAASAAIAALLVAAFTYWRRSRRPRPGVLTHEERALAELDRLEATLAPQGPSPRAFSEALSTLLRRYVADRYALPAPRQTTAEFLATVDPTQRDQLRAVLERCDLVKFAGASPTAEENREMLQVVRSFVEGSQKLSPAAVRQVRTADG